MEIETIEPKMPNNNLLKYALIGYAFTEGLPKTMEIMEKDFELDSQYDDEKLTSGLMFLFNDGFVLVVTVDMKIPIASYRILIMKRSSGAKSASEVIHTKSYIPMASPLNNRIGEEEIEACFRLLLNDSKRIMDENPVETFDMHEEHNE